MAGNPLALFGRKNKDDGGKGDGDGAGNLTFQRDPRKARKFFEHAEATADSRQYDYAIECYVNGLRFDPDNMEQHEALYEVAKRRKVGGGKPPGIKDKLSTGGKDPINKLMHAEKLWAMDPINVQAMLNAMERAAEADQVIEDINLGDLVLWFGEQVLEFNAGAKKPSKTIFLKARDRFAQINRYDKAVEACSMALQLDPESDQLLQDLKDLEAERTMSEGGYTEAKEEGGFKAMVKDMDKQRALEEESAISKGASALENIINRRRTEYEQNPDDPEILQKLVDALEENATEESESEAVKLLQQVHEKIGEYRYRVRIGDIQMKQMNRTLRELKKRYTDNPDDARIKQEFAEAARKQLLFELQEFDERVKNYPTDLKLKYELGRRLFMAQKYDEAIGAFQQAKNDPKVRAASHEFLGRSYIEQSWLQEAVDTLKQGIELHPIADDRLGMDLRYYLMDALERVARKDKAVETAREAQKVASQILQTNIGYRDIRTRIDKIRALVDELQKETA
ncbi:MAG: hypothetical protein V3U29_04980 [Phycisphaeraceae bacterium]